ncbi:hypothetical protein BH09MYX1_BH09MYX1_63050 [soil metagenome]
MRKHRLDRLAKLTQGAALLGLGVLAAACNNEPRQVNSPDPTGSTEPIHVNSPPSATETTPAPSASQAPPMINAPPSAAPSVVPSAAPSTKPSTAPLVPVHMNAQHQNG